MKAIRVEKHGGPEVLKLREIAPIEPPGPGQPVVRVIAAGVNFVDVGQRRGTYPRQVPFTPGVEGAGVVESVGEGVRSVKPSDRVAFTGLPGAYAEALLADAERRIPLPDEFTFEQGAAFPLQGVTAHYLIHEFRRPVPGSFVLIHAAAIRGHIVIFGAASGPADPVSPNALMSNALTVSGGSLQNYVRTPEELMQRANDVIAGIRAGWLKLNIGRVLPLAQAAQAHELLESRKTEGKLVLSVAN
jgi:NADPH:quinone reductase-like Zn-dependent oxidoreductase